MPAPNAVQQIQEVPLKMVGGNSFGRYPKISVEQTWNMIVSDDALVTYAGYKNVLTQSPLSEGRGLYSSSRGNLMLAIWGSQAYTISPSLMATFRGNLLTTAGDVFIAENNNAEIAFSDGFRLYVYNWFTDTFKTSGIDFNLPAALTNPGYISFQNGRLILANTNSSNWYLSAPNDATNWPNAASSIGALQTKPDTVQAAVPTPGGGNTLFLFGHNVVEQWQDVGNALFPYQRASTFNVDYGTLNASSIAALDDYVVWIAGNEQSGATVMLIEGGRAVSISTDGIDFKLANLKNPTNCNGFLFRQDGHVIYQFTFPDDNLSYALDLKTKLFFTVSDENLNYHIARNVVFFNNFYFFVSLNGGNLYEFDTDITDIDYGDGVLHEIPRIRVCPPFRLPDQRMFIVKSLGFTIENGRTNHVQSLSNITQLVTNEISTENLFSITTEDDDILITEAYVGPTYNYTIYSEAVDLSTSRDGGESFGNSYRLNMNAIGKRKSRFIYQRLGQTNDFTAQLRFSGFGRFLVFDGEMEIYK